VLKDGEHTGTKPGRALWGPGRSDSGELSVSFFCVAQAFTPGTKNGWFQKAPLRGFRWPLFFLTQA
jgi:hypothetical protein